MVVEGVLSGDAALEQRLIMLGRLRKLVGQVLTTAAYTAHEHGAATPAVAAILALDTDIGMQIAAELGVASS